MKVKASFWTFFLLCSFSFGQVTFIIDQLPAGTPPNDPIHIAGSFQGWDPGDSNYQLEKDSLTSVYSLTLNNLSGSIEYKFTRGSWPKVESDANGGVVGNRSSNLGAGDTLRINILGWEDIHGQTGSNSTAAANVSVLTDSFYIPQLNRYRRIWLYLPPDYASSGLSYPVLYMHDGQNLFDAETSFSGEWEVDETLNELHAQGDPGIIVVAIDNGSSNRAREYSPWPNTTYGGGEGAAYVDFLVQELKPYIDSSYRTRPERESTGIMGSSLGALISTYAGLKYQDVFGKVGAFSPAYWFNPEIFDFVSDHPKSQSLRIYQNVGSKEGSRFVRDMNAMSDSLIAAGFESSNIKSIEKADGEHSEWFWAREFEDAYVWLFRTSTHRGQDLTQADAFRLYPNPSSGELLLDMELKVPAKLQMEILDANGKKLQTYTYSRRKAGKQQIKLELDRTIFVPGNYFCRLISGEHIQILRFVLR